MKAKFQKYDLGGKEGRTANRSLPPTDLKTNSNQQKKPQSARATPAPLRAGPCSSHLLSLQENGSFGDAETFAQTPSPGKPPRPDHRAARGSPEAAARRRPGCQPTSHPAPRARPGAGARLSASPHPRGPQARLRASRRHTAPPRPPAGTAAVTGTPRAAPGPAGGDPPPPFPARARLSGIPRPASRQGPR